MSRTPGRPERRPDASRPGRPELPSGKLPSVMQAPAYAENQVAATPPNRISTAVAAHPSMVGAGPVRMLTARQRAASAEGRTPNRATRRLLHGKHPQDGAG
jgi:hypothetical protein